LLILEGEENLEIRAFVFSRRDSYGENDKSISETFYDIERMAEECKKGFLQVEEREEG